MRCVEKKFGGTSVGNIARILEVAKKVAAAHDQGDRVVVVVSARAGETNRLVSPGGANLPKVPSPGNFKPTASRPGENGNSKAPWLANCPLKQHGA